MSFGISGYGAAVLKRIVYGSTISIFRDRLRVRGERARAVRHRRHAIDRERDVLGRQLAAVVELDALAQLELPRLVVERLPRRRDAGNHPRVRVHLHELVEDVLGDVVVGKQVEEVRVDRRDVGGDRDLELLRRRRGSASDAATSDGGGRQARQDGECDAWKPRSRWWNGRARRDGGRRESSLVAAARQKRCAS